MSILKHIKDIAQRKAKPGVRRSNEWPKVRATYLKQNPKCAVCGGVKKLEVHHKVPFHKDSSKELDLTNLITLCEANKNGVNCHQLFGHLGDFKSINTDVEGDAKTWSAKISLRVEV